MTAVTFDTLKFAKRLEAAGLPRSQAEAIADALSSSLAPPVGSGRRRPWRSRAFW